jgi:hypothetical protein
MPKLGWVVHKTQLGLPLKTGSFFEGMTYWLYSGNSLLKEKK